MMNEYTTKYPYPEFYFQGGTGILMSRRAVEEFVKVWDFFYMNFNDYEDRTVTNLVLRAGVSFKKLSSTYFIGDRVNNDFADFFNKANFSGIPPCPSNHPITKCAHEFYYLNKVASLHKIDDYNHTIEEMIKSGVITDKIRFYYNNFAPRICSME